MRRLVPSILLALACVVVIGAGAPGAGALTRDSQVKQGIRLLKVYADGYAAAHGFVYPAAAVVKKGGGLTAPVWPVNPWTGKPMAPGTSPGCFTYTVDPDGAYYELVGHLSRASLTVSGGPPSWLIDERTTAAADLSEAEAAATAAQAAATEAAADLAPSQDAAARNGLAMIQEAARNIAQGTGAPPTTQILTYEMLHASWPGWPTSAFDGQPMHQGWQPGDFTYTPGADGSWTFVAHLTSGDYTLTQSAFDWAAYKDALTIQNTTFIGWGIELDTLYEYGTAQSYPPTYPYPQGGWGTFLDPWPQNPYTRMNMASSTSKGDYRYTQGNGTYDLTANLCDGTTYDVGKYTRSAFRWLWRWTIRSKDQLAQSRLQVLKGCVDAWRAAHSGTLPTADQMRPDGAVGAACSWWPENPWMYATGMAPGTDKGCYEYSVDAGGGYSLVLHQQALPMINGDPTTAIPDTYTAQ